MKSTLFSLLFIAAIPTVSAQTIPSEGMTTRAAANGISLIDAYCIEDYVAPGETFSFCYTLVNNSYSRTLSSFSVNYYIAGRLIKSLNKGGISVSRGSYTEVMDELVMPADMITGPKEIRIEITALDGTKLANALIETTRGNVAIASDYRKRDKYLLELFTSTSCTQCPRGKAFVDYMMEKHPEYTLAELHLNTPSTDPFTISANNSVSSWLGVNGTPSLSLNRIFINEESTVNPGFEASSYSKVEPQYAAVVRDYSLPCFTELSVTAEISQDGKNLEIRVVGEGGEYARDLLDEHALTVYVLENGLPYTQAAMNGIIMHDNVVRAIPTNPLGSKLQWNSGSTFEHEYSVKLDDKWRTENMEVLAFVNGISDVPFYHQVMTATRIPVSTVPSGIVAPMVSMSQAPEAYDLTGRKINAARPGIFIVGGRKIVR